MKKIITLLLALGLGVSVVAPVTAEARDHRHFYRQSYSHRCNYCGGGIYRQQVFVGYNRYGSPVYSWRTAPHVHRSHPGRGHGHQRHDHHRHNDWNRGRVSSSGFYFGIGR